MSKEKRTWGSAENISIVLLNLGLIRQLVFRRLQDGNLIRWIKTQNGSGPGKKDFFVRKAFSYGLPRPVQIGKAFLQGNVEHLKC